MEYVARLFRVSNYMPHGDSFHWRPDLVAIHAGSDLLIAASCLSISAAILLFLRKHPDVPRAVAKLFVTFVALLGLAQLMSVVVVWYPAYAVQGLIELAVALVSVATAAVLWPLIPRLAALPSRAELEQRNRQIEELNRKLQQRIDSLGTLAGGVSHDFNNLLTVIKGHAQLMMEETDSPDARENLEAISASAGRAVEVCRQMLAYSGRGHFMLEELNLNDIVEQMALPATANADFNYGLSSTLKPIHASPDQMRQMITDLCTNAVEAIVESATDKGELSLRTYVTRLDRQTLDRAAFNHDMLPGEAVVLEVADNGVGMSPRVCERVFEPYYSTKFVGRGLGMAAVQGIVRGHHGCVFITTAPGEGTRVKVAFPTTQAASSQYRAPRISHPRTILVVDDEAEVLSLARQYLATLGITTLATTDAGEALRLVRRHKDRLDAVLIDFLLPYTSGSDLLHQIAEICDVDAYLTSGYSRDEIEDPTLRRLLTGYIAKPFDLADFRALFAPAAVKVN